LFEVLIDELFDGPMQGGDQAAEPAIAMANQIKPLLVVEVSFARRAANLDDDQVRALVEKSRAGWLKCAKDSMQGNQQMMGNAVWFGNVERNQVNLPDELAKVVATAIKQVASDQQLAAYEQQLAARNEFRKQATLDEIVCMIDGELLLDEQQRQALRESLEKRWKDSWASNIEALQQFGDQYFPVLPDAAVTPHLTPKQKSRWNSLQKVSASVGFGNNMFGAQFIDDVNIADAKPDTTDDAEEQPAADNRADRVQMQLAVPALMLQPAAAVEQAGEAVEEARDTPAADPALPAREAPRAEEIEE
jgi:predicted transcriptional regulator